MLRIRTHLGSIIDPDVGAHAIVNASNPHVGLGSGVSGAIREACGGVSFQQEVRAIWEDEFDEPLQAGDCLVTGAGTATAFRWVLHVPTVDYKVPDPQTGGVTSPARIRKCVSAVLEEAVVLSESHHLQGRFVLAMPLLGAGHGGLGEVAAVAAMLSGFRGVPKLAESLAAVVWVAMTERGVRCVENAARAAGMMA